MFVTEAQRRNFARMGSNPAERLDPHKLYEEERAYHRATATGVGKLVFEYIPFSIIKSFALAIDPLKKFRGAPVKITAVNRTRWRERRDILSPRKFTLVRKRRHIVSQQKPGQGLFCYHKVDSGNSGTVILAQNSNLLKQTPVLTTTKDTTAKSRPPESGFGEFEQFRYSIHSPPMAYTWHELLSNQIEFDPACSPQEDTWDDNFINTTFGQGAVMSKSTLEQLRTSEISMLTTEMQNQALKLLSKTVPMSRRYTMFRNVVELKDVPRAILGLKRAVENFDRSISLMSYYDRIKVRKYLNSNSKSIPGEYVSYHFGWAQIYRDVMDLLVKPIRAVREVNRLQRRSGQPTTFRTRIKYPGPTTTTPNFTYDTDTIFGLTTGSKISEVTRHEREFQLRLVVNATFDFPRINVPQFKKELFLHKLGVNPMPTDLYNLVPWSWLLDWFTGLGNYVEAIDIINTDRSLYNWGLLTGITKGKITTTRLGKVTDKTDVKINGVRVVGTAERRFTHESVCEYHLQIRKNITSAYGVKTILEPANLSLYQKSILAAILASRRKG